MNGTEPRTGSSRESLSDLRVLLVEDVFLTAFRLKTIVEQFGCDVIGPAPNVEDALDLIDRRGCDAALLDINLGEESVEPVARRLIEMDVPFVFVTGYASPPRESPLFRERPRLLKPLDPALLQRVMKREFLSPGPRGDELH
jgi:two-component SAPR family response regulator